MALDNVITLENAVIGVNDHIVLTDVNLSVEKSEFVYVIGRVGSGKTSLIKTINAELPLLGGYWNGIRISTGKDQEEGRSLC